MEATGEEPKLSDEGVMDSLGTEAITAMGQCCMTVVSACMIIRQR